MWLEAILTREDLENALHKLAPFTLKLGRRGSVQLDAPTSVSLVEGRGLRVACPATVHGSILGMEVPVSIRSATVLLAPSIASRARGDVVLFRATIETIDVAALPELVERAAVDAINGALMEHDAELCWEFRETLSHCFALPEGLTRVPSLDVSASWGELRITAEALVFAVSFQDAGSRSLVKAS